jgi:hypothetical protein
MVAEPEDSAVTTPFASTEATAAFKVDHVTVAPSTAMPVLPEGVAVNAIFAPAGRIAPLPGFRETEYTGLMTVMFADATRPSDIADTVVVPVMATKFPFTHRTRVGETHPFTPSALTVATFGSLLTQSICLLRRTLPAASFRVATS